MEIIIDTDVVIAGERGVFDLEAWLALQASQLAVSAITVAELWHGVERASANRKPRRQRYIETFLSRIVVHPYTEHTAYVHAGLLATQKTSGAGIGAYDLIIAATAIYRSAAVATFNTRHFSLIAGLEVIHPATPGR